MQKRRKKIELTEELLDDEAAGLMTFLADHISRAMALTQNAMLLTEIAANGSVLDTFASTTAIAAGEIENLVFHDTLSYYLDDGPSCAWVMRPATFGTIKKITGDSRLYDSQVLGSRGDLFGYPVYYSSSAAAPQASAISMYFGNWYMCGWRQDTALKFIRDPYSTDGLVILKYSFRACAGVLVAGGIGYGKHPTG